MISDKDKKQIEERAAKFEFGLEPVYRLNWKTDAYIAGATDQKLIDQAEIEQKTETIQGHKKTISWYLETIQKQAAEIAKLERLMPIGLITLNDEITQLTEQLRVATETLNYYNNIECADFGERAGQALEQIKKLGEK